MANSWPIRVATKAIIVENRRILVVKHRQVDDFYTLPGGGTNQGEDSRTALQRECLEELGAQVRVGELRYVRDYVADNHGFAVKTPPGFHQVELMFECFLTSPEFGEPLEMDQDQVGIEWLPLDGLESCRLYPLSLRRRLAVEAGGSHTGPIYLGDVN